MLDPAGQQDVRGDVYKFLSVPCVEKHHGPLMETQIEAERERPGWAKWQLCGDAKCGVMS